MSSSEIPNKSEISTSSDCVDRHAVDMLAYRYLKEPTNNNMAFYEDFLDLPSVVPQVPRCKECKWWKDSDGAFRRGIGAESQCPINTQAVYCGDGYCYMFSPKADMRGEGE